ncbi:MAG: putative N6-adenine-specific DNA methylase [Lentimonas sp.]|jgi:putative N6-adenine-specific DNA methylase
MAEEEENKEIIITMKTLFGLEEVLKEELVEMGYKDVEVLNRAVQIKGAWSDVYYLNLHLRCAISILVQIKSFRIKDEKELYDRAMKIDWTQYFDVDKTFAVKGAVFSTLFSHSQYPHLLLKDAIVDTFRNKTGDRPDVMLKAPQVLFDLYIKEKQVIISLNTSGVPLYQRGYRESVGDAPLNEVAAAGLLRLAKWDKKTNLYDPFCGSGTILIEAALMASDVPACINRHHFAFKNFKNFDPELWDSIKSQANQRIKDLPFILAGSDSSAEMMTMAKRNMRGLGLGRIIDVKADSFQESKKPFDSGMIITNPPYGERIGEEVEELYAEFGTWMKHVLTGCTCWLISSNEEALKHIGLRPERRIKLYNGDLECSFRKFTIYDGSKKASKNNYDNYPEQDTEQVEEDDSESNTEQE